MAGYWVIRGSAIRDAEALRQYVELWADIGERYGAEVIAGIGKIDTREGMAYPRHLVIRFDSYDKAVACYEDPAYKSAMELAHKAYDRELVILEG